MVGQSAFDDIGEAPGLAPMDVEVPNQPAIYVMDEEDSDQVE